MGGSEKERPGPSYEEGKVREQDVERKQDEGFKPSDLLRIMKKAVSRKA